MPGRGEGGSVWQGPLCLLGLLVIISKQAEKPRHRMSGKKTIRHCSALMSCLLVSCPWLFLSQLVSVNICENKFVVEVVVVI